MRRVREDRESEGSINERRRENRESEGIERKGKEGKEGRAEDIAARYCRETEADVDY